MGYDAYARQLATAGLGKATQATESSKFVTKIDDTITQDLSTNLIAYGAFPANLSELEIITIIDNGLVDTETYADSNLEINIVSTNGSFGFKIPNAVPVGGGGTMFKDLTQKTYTVYDIPTTIAYTGDSPKFPNHSYRNSNYRVSAIDGNTYTYQYDAEEETEQNPTPAFYGNKLKFVTSDGTVEYGWYITRWEGEEDDLTNQIIFTNFDSSASACMYGQVQWEQSGHGIATGYAHIEFINTEAATIKVSGSGKLSALEDNTLADTKMIGFLPAGDTITTMQIIVDGEKIKAGSRFIIRYKK